MTRPWLGFRRQLRSPGRGATRPRTSAAPAVFDPATLSLTGWWRADFSGSPWAGVASAGSSGSRNLSEGTTPPDTTGDAINDLEPANFNGTNDLLTTGAAVMSDFVGDSCSGWVLFNADAASADAGANVRWNNPQFFADANQILGAGFSSAGVHLAILDSVAGVAEKVVPCDPGGWRLMKWRLTHSVQLDVAIDGNAFATPTDFAGRTMHPSRTLVCRVGPRGTGVGPFFDGRIAEIAVTNSALSDENFDDVVSYINSRYGLSL